MYGEKEREKRQRKRMSVIDGAAVVLQRKKERARERVGRDSY